MIYLVSLEKVPPKLNDDLRIIGLPVSSKANTNIEKIFPAQIQLIQKVSFIDFYYDQMFIYNMRKLKHAMFSPVLKRFKQTKAIPFFQEQMIIILIYLP